MYDAPIAEVSGACFAGDRLVLVGDAAPVLAWAPWAGGPGTWSLIDVADLPGAPPETGQFEAVTHVGADTVVIVCEGPSLLVAVDLRQRRVTGCWHLRVDLPKLAKAWRKDENSRGEGLFFGADRVFLGKEKRPATIIEFGPAGAASLGEPKPGDWQMPPSGDLVALARHDVDLPDVSDVCVADGIVWLLSDQDRCLQPLGGEPVALPAHIDKPEGLARTPEGDWLVAVDNRDGRNALFVEAVVAS